MKIREILQYTYWNKINQFRLAEDTYNEWVMFAIEDGKFKFEIDGYSGMASIGDIVFCPPRENFSRKVVKPLTFHFIRLDFSEMSLELSNSKLSITDINRLSSSYQYLKKLALHDPQHKQWMTHLLFDILVLYNIESNQTRKSRTSKGSDQLIEKARKYMDNHAFEKHTQIGQISFTFGLSPVQFTRRFKDHYHLTPQEYLTSLRLNQAKSLLLETNYTIDHIAHLCGYNNGFYLSRVFSRKLNVTPSRYRVINRI